MKKALAAILLLVCATLSAHDSSGYSVSVLMRDAPRPQYSARGNVYVEAVRGEDYSLRITNPTSFRVAVALSVDGLNTIDARHTDPWNAAKWVLGPYESAVIAGWQINHRDARRFYFTGERDSYAAALGQPANLGVIEAVFYRERSRQISVYAPRAEEQAGKAQAGATNAAPPSDDYAATGMGSRTGQEVESVDIDLEKAPVATVRIRYEFHDHLVKLGVLPRVDPMERRERARGFCPEP